jgi:hypothetical protein
MIEKTRPEVTESFENYVKILSTKFEPKALGNLLVGDRPIDHEQQEHVFGKKESIQGLTGKFTSDNQLVQEKLQVIDNAFFTTVAEGEKRRLQRQDGVADVSAKLFNFLKESEKDKKIKNELRKNSFGQSHDEDKKRHEELISTIEAMNDENEKFDDKKLKEIQSETKDMDIDSEGFTKPMSKPMSKSTNTAKPIKKATKKPTRTGKKSRKRTANRVVSKKKTSQTPFAMVATGTAILAGYGGVKKEADAKSISNVPTPESKTPTNTPSVAKSSYTKPSTHTDVPQTSTDKLPSETVVQAIDKASELVGVDRSLMYAMAKQESNFNPNAKAGTSSAKGLYQFINATWEEMVKKYGSKYPILVQKGPTDPEASAIAGALYIKENSAILSSAGIPIDGTTIYASHFLGPGGAKNLLTANPNEYAYKILPNAAASNKNIFFNKDKSPRTVREVIDVLYQKVGKYQDSYAKALNITPQNSQVSLASSQPISPVVSGDKLSSTSITPQNSQVSLASSQPISPVVSGDKLSSTSITNKELKEQINQSNILLAVNNSSTTINSASSGSPKTLTAPISLDLPIALTKLYG